MKKVFGFPKMSLYEHFWWGVHNVIAHPLWELLKWCYMEPLGDRFHEWTVPRK